MKPELIAFSENVLGGIQTYYLNLLTNCDETFQVNWLLLNHSGEIRAKAPLYSLENTKINYNVNYGRWRRAKQISKYLTKRPGIVLANREFELDCLALYPCKSKTIYHIVHDEYYIQFAIRYCEIIDIYIAHNSFIFKQLIAMLPEREKDIVFLPFGVRLSPFHRQSNLDRKLTLVFIARLDKSKGILDLPLIDDILLKNKVEVNWTIIGDGTEKENFLNLIKDKKNFKCIVAKDDLEIFKEAQFGDIFILPSLHDGTPVALLESMSAGLVPIIYNFNDGIKDVVTEEVGYIVDKGDVNAFSNRILFLNSNREILEEKSINAIKSAEKNYDVKNRAREYYSFFKNFEKHKKPHNYTPEKPSFRENPFIPQFFINYIILTFRYLKKI